MYIKTPVSKWLQELIKNASILREVEVIEEIDDYIKIKHLNYEGTLHKNHLSLDKNEKNISQNRNIVYD